MCFFVAGGGEVLLSRILNTKQNPTPQTLQKSALVPKLMLADKEAGIGFLINVIVLYTPQPYSAY